MTHWTRCLTIAAITALSSGPTFAATYYLSDCKPGAAPACVAGDVANDGLSAAKPKQLASQLPRLQGGDKVLFARGGSWVDASMNIYVATASATNPVTWDSYAPHWGGTAKPILLEARQKYLFNLNDGGAKAADGGYVIRNLDLRGGGVFGGVRGGLAGVFLYWAVNDVLIDNVEISGFTNGVYTAHNPAAANGWENYRVTIRNSYLHNNLMSSFLGGASELVIENNVLDRNGERAILDHDLYISSAARAVIRGNTITRSALDINGNCSGSAIVVHGGVDGLTIENNKILQKPGSVPQCFGIEISGGYPDTSPSEYFNDVTIRGNTVVDVGYIGIGLRGCNRCVVENNQLVWTGKGGSQAISMSVNTPSATDQLGTALTIRNNSIFMADASGSPGVIRLVDEGTGHSVISNLIVLGSATSASAKCYGTASYVFSSFAAFDNNLCFRQGGSATYSSAFATLAAAQQAGFDLNGSVADPLLASTPSSATAYSLAVKTGSPAAAAGHRTRSAPTDFFGRSRGAAPDIGAYQLGQQVQDTVAPAAPRAVALE